VANLSTFVFDRFSPISYKATIGETASNPHMAPTWVGDIHVRRLAAYKTRLAYLLNVSRLALPQGSVDAAVTDERARMSGQFAVAPTSKDRREYGDAALLSSRVVDAVLGEDVQIVVDGAAVPPAVTPELPPEPQPLAPQPADPLPIAGNAPPAPDAAITAMQRRIDTIRTARWVDEAERKVAEWEASFDAHHKASERQRWLRKWAEDEQVIAKMYEAEGDAVGLGDAVYVISWSAKKRRPVLDVFDPGFYFPVLDPNSRESYPDKVHIAWQFEEMDRAGTKKQFVHRITYELKPVAEWRPPWAAEEDQPSTVACFMSEGTWPLNDAGRTVDDFADSRATWTLGEDGRPIQDLNLGIDFVPVLHVPNTPSRKEHYGPSILDSVTQIVDDIQAADTDAAAASRIAGTPLITLAGGQVDHTKTLSVGPGKVFTVGPNGRMDVLDASRGLVVLMDYIDKLLHRLSVNSQVNEEVLGRVRASDVPSGIALLLAFGPMRGLIRKMRLVRNEKYPLLLKFAQRLAQAGGVLEAGANPRAEVAFGSFLPSDQKHVLECVVQLMTTHGISRRTALQWLVDAGFDIGDIAQELDAIAAEDFDHASTLSDVVGKEQAAEYLGREAPPPDAAQPALNLRVPTLGGPAAPNAPPPPPA
jgi:hypothetical protein